MRVFFDLDSRQLIQKATSLSSVISVLNFTRGDAPDLEVKFVREGAVTDMTGGVTGLFFCVKPKGGFAGNPLVLLTDFTAEGGGVDTVWTGKPNFNTTELSAAFGLTPYDAGLAALASLEGVGELGYLNADGDQVSSRQIKVIVANDVYRGDEGMSPATPSTGLKTLVAMPATSATEGAPGDYAISGTEFAIYKEGTGFVFFTGFTK